MRFLHVSDTHLGARPYGSRDREADFYDVFSEVIDLAVEYGVSFVLHGGDLFHSSNPSPKAYIEAIRGLARLRERGIDFIVAPGNHELPKSAGRGSPIKVLEHIGLLRSPRDPSKPDVFNVGDVSIIVFSEWASSYLFNPDILQLYNSRIKIALAHITLCDILRDVEGVPERACRDRSYYSSRIPSGYSYVALGDIHTPWELRVPGRPPIVYPGSTEYLGVDEYRRHSERYVYLIDIESSGDISFKRIPLKKPRRWIIVEDTYSNVLNKLNVSSISRLSSTSDKKPILYVKVKEPIPRDRRDMLIKHIHRLIDDGLILDYRLEVEVKGSLVERKYTSGVSVDDILKTEVFGKINIRDMDKILGILASMVKPESDLDNLIKELIGLLEGSEDTLRVLEVALKSK